MKSPSSLLYPMVFFPIGPCCLGQLCQAPTHQLRKHCPGCQGLIHVVCGRVLFDDEGEYKADATICPQCDPTKRSTSSSMKPSSNQQNEDSNDSDDDGGTQEESDVEQSGRKRKATEDDDGGDDGGDDEDEGGGKDTGMSETTTKKKKKKKAPPQPTGRKPKTPRVKIAIRKRVKATRVQLYHVLKSDAQRACIPKTTPNNYNFFGTVVSRGKNKSSWNVRFDVLPLEENVIENFARTKLEVIGDGEEEKPLNEHDQALFESIGLESDAGDERREESSGATGQKKKKKNPTAEFCNMDGDAIRNATTFSLLWGEDDNIRLTWEILRDGEYVTDADDPLELPEKLEFQDEGWEDDAALSDPTEMFFEHIFPDITGMYQEIVYYYAMHLCL